MDTQEWVKKCYIDGGWRFPNETPPPGEGWERIGDYWVNKEAKKPVEVKSNVPRPETMDFIGSGMQGGKTIAAWNEVLERTRNIAVENLREAKVATPTPEKPITPLGEDLRRTIAKRRFEKEVSDMEEISKAFKMPPPIQPSLAPGPSYDFAQEEDARIMAEASSEEFKKALPPMSDKEILDMVMRSLKPGQIIMRLDDGNVICGIATQWTMNMNTGWAGSLPETTIDLSIVITGDGASFGITTVANTDGGDVDLYPTQQKKGKPKPKKVVKRQTAFDKRLKNLALELEDPEDEDDE